MDVLNTRCGQIKGVESLKDSSVEVFKGIRYATAERFADSIIVSKWDGVYDATTFKDCSYQQRSFEDESQNKSKAFYYREFRENEKYSYSEDCLNLNIWKPKGAKNLPVLFYIHGGSFTGGCGFEKHFEGEAWCKKGIIVITINYRLGPFGFLANKWLENNNGVCGNWAIKDMLCALKWVKENIKDYGGDPNNITLAGQSAGAIGTQTLVLSGKISKDIHKVLMFSGGGVGSIMNPGKFTIKRSYKFWDKVVVGAGVTNLAELKNVEPEKLYNSFRAATKAHPLLSYYCCSPCVDGDLLKDKGTKLQTKVKEDNTAYMMSSTSEDIIPPIVFNMAKNWANTHNNSYQAFFKRQLPGDTKGAWHSSDLWYFFGSLSNGWRPFEKEDYELSNTMITYYSNFVKTGNPNDENLPTWKNSKESNGEVMVFDKESKMMKISKSKLFFSLFGIHGKGEN